MPRPPVISFNDVEEAVKIVQSKKKPLNAYQVKKVLGKGSEAKITYYLKGMGLTLEYQKDDPLTTRLNNLLRPVVMELNEQVDEQILREKDVLNQKLDQAKLQQQSNQDALSEVESKLADARSTSENYQEEIKGLKEFETNLKSTVQSLTHTLSEMTLKLENKQQALNEAANNFKLVKNEHKQVTALLRTEHTETIDGYKLALDQSNLSQEKLTKDNIKQTIYLEKSQALIVALKANNHEQALELKNTSTQLTLANKANSKLEMSLQSESELLKCAQQKIQSLEQKLLSSSKIKTETKQLEKTIAVVQKDNEQLKAQLVMAESIIDKFSVQSTKKKKKS